VHRRRAVFLDRDGTVIEDRHFLADPEGVALLPGAAEAIARLNRAGLPVLLVTNQSGIGRGYFGEDEFRAVQERLEALLRDAGAHLDGVYHCPHAPGADPPCDCRKPATGLFRRAAAEHGVEPGDGFYIGDRLRDVVPGTGLGGEGFLIVAADGTPTLDPVTSRVVQVPSLAAAVDRVLATVGVD